MHNRNTIPRKLIFFYRKTLSPRHSLVRALLSSPLFSLTPGVRPGCRFWPSCSVYAEEAFAQRPFFSACALIARRLFRCRFGSCGGIDPVCAHQKSSITDYHD